MLSISDYHYIIIVIITLIPIIRNKYYKHEIYWVSCIYVLQLILYWTNQHLYSSVCFRYQPYSRELHGDNALKYGRSIGTATTYAAELRELAGAVQSGSARLEGYHATRYAICQAQRTSYTASKSHTYVRATGHRNTRRARWTQLTTVSIIMFYLYL